MFRGCKFGKLPMKYASAVPLTNSPLAGRGEPGGRGRLPSRVGPRVDERCGVLLAAAAPAGRPPSSESLSELSPSHSKSPSSLSLAHEDNSNSLAESPVRLNGSKSSSKAAPEDGCNSPERQRPRSFLVRLRGRVAAAPENGGGCP